MQAVVTNGISTLVTSASVTNFQLLASDLSNLGSAFNIEDIANFGNPGQVIGSISAASGLTITGLDTVLAGVGIDPVNIYNLGDPSYNDIMQIVLDSVTTPELVSNAQTVLETDLKDMDSLGDYTNFDKIFVNSRDVISFSTMAEFVELIQAIELGRIDTLTELAEYVNNVEPVTLPTISNTTQFTRSDYIDSLIAKFLGGSGLYGSVTLVDIIGSLGGITISTYATEYITVMNRLNSAGELTALQSRLDELTNGLNGNFTSGSSPDFVITDPNGGATYGPSDPPDYAGFQAAKIGQIEAACAAIMSRRNVNADIQTAIDSWRAISKKVFDEKDFQSRIDMNYDIRTNFSDNANNFVQGLRGTINERGKGPIINGLVNQAVLDGDVGGEYLRAYIKELENKAVADTFDIRWRAEFDE